MSQKVGLEVVWVGQMNLNFCEAVVCVADLKITNDRCFLYDPFSY